MEVLTPGLASKLQQHGNSYGREMLSIDEPLTHGTELPAVDDFISILQKCRDLKTLAHAKRVHLHICDMGLDAHQALGNYLVPVFMHCGSIPDAQQVFNRLIFGNEFSWTSLIQGYVERRELQHAFNLYKRMQEESVNPSKYTCMALLKGCASLKSLEKGRELHAEIVKQEYEKDLFVGSTLVDMYAKCGLPSDAWKVFDNLPERNVVSWTALISGLADHGFGNEALTCFWKMQSEGVFPNAVTYFCSLKACASIEDICTGQSLHAEIAKEGIETDCSVGSSLVDMYAKCGSLVEAQGVFDELSAKDVVSWTALITGYANHGLGEDALNCLEQMQLEGVPPDAVTLLCILKACGSVGDIHRGQEIHTQIVKGGFERDPSAGNALVDMYAKGGSLVDAQQIFDNLAVQNIVSWTVLLAGYAEHGLSEEALDCAERMQLEGVPPDAVIFLYSLKACGSLTVIDKGRVIHAEIALEGFERDHFVGSALLDMYVKCDSLAEAQEVFDDLASHDLVLWNALLGGYAEQGLGEELLNHLEEMESEGICPDAFTSVCSLKACCTLGSLDRGRIIHADITKKGFEKDSFIGNALVDMYAKCGSYVEAQEVLDKLLVQDAISWNTLMAGYVEQGLGEHVLKCFECMEKKGVSPDVVTLVCSLKACGIIQAVDRGRKLHAQIAMKKYEGDPFAGNTLVDMYAKCGLLAEAEDVFNKLPVQGIVSWTALIAGYAEHGLCQEAMDCFQKMQLEGVSPDLLSWNALILGYAEQADSDKAFKLFGQMQDQGLPPDSVTFLSVLKACSTEATLETGKNLHAQMSTAGAGPTKVRQSTALVDMYSKCGSMIDAQQVFDTMPKKDLVTWNALTTGYARQGQCKHVFNSFEKMQEEHMQPDEGTFLNVLSVCSHAGLVWKGQRYFEAMSRDYSVNPAIKHYSCMVDLLSRAGQLEEAVEMVNTMPLQPDLVLWSTILSACCKWGNVELGKQAFENMVGLGDYQSASFAMMSNIYADVH